MPRDHNGIVSFDAGGVTGRGDGGPLEDYYTRVGWWSFFLSSNLSSCSSLCPGGNSWPRGWPGQPGGPGGWGPLEDSSGGVGEGVPPLPLEDIINGIIICIIIRIIIIMIIRIMIQMIIPLIISSSGSGGTPSPTPPLESSRGPHPPGPPGWPGHPRGQLFPPGHKLEQLLKLLLKKNDHHPTLV